MPQYSGMTQRGLGGAPVTPQPLYTNMPATAQRFGLGEPTGLPGRTPTPLPDPGDVYAQQERDYTHAQTMKRDFVTWASRQGANRQDIQEAIDIKGWDKIKQPVVPKAVARKTLKDVAGQQRYSDTGERVFPGVEKPEGKTSAETSYIPAGEDKFQYMSVPKGGGEAVPVLRDGKPVFLSEKQVLIAEGKKAQSLINPYETKFLSKLGDSEGARITELKAKATDSVASKQIIAEARVLLDQGIYAGTAANIRKNFDKILQEGDIFIGGRKAANTEAYASMMGLQVGKIIKQFGAGTGLSDADREYAEKIVGGRVTLTEDAIRRLLDINDRLADFTISEYNSQAARAKRDIEEKDYLRPIEVPPVAAPLDAGDFEAQYAAMPSGTEFTAPDGTQRRKP